MGEQGNDAELRVRALESTVEELRQLVLEQRARIEDLERTSDAPVAPHAAVASGAPVAPPEPDAPTGHDDHPEQAEPRWAGGGVGRRRLLIGGATAAASAAAAVVATSSPAAAANGSSIVLGSLGNTSSSETVLTGTVDGYPVLNVVNEGTGAALQGSNTSESIAAIRGQGTKFDGVWGGSDSGPGVRATSNSGAGLVASSDSGMGVSGTSNTGSGVYGLSTSGIGVWGQSTSDTGVQGESSSGPALSGVSVTGYGLYAQSTSSIAVDALSATGVGVYGQSDSADGVQGVSASGHGVFAQSDSNVAIGAISTQSAGVSVFGGTVGVEASGGSGPGVTADSAFAQLRLVRSLGRAAPTGDAVAHEPGDLVEDASGALWLCVAAGTPGAWRKIAGPSTAGAFHVLPAPVRVYDSRPGTSPSQGPKTPLSGNLARAIDCTVNNSKVPVGATAVSLTVLLVNAAQANGNLTIWANGAARPAANTAVWGTGSGRYTTTTICALDAAAKIQASASTTTDLVLDVVGYYR